MNVNPKSCVAWNLFGLASAVTGAALIGGWSAALIVFGSWIGVITIADMMVLSLKSSKQ